MPENHLSEVAAFQVFLSGRVCVFGDTLAYPGGALTSLAEFSVQGVTVRHARRGE
jgi:hypothetical protein